MIVDDDWTSAEDAQLRRSILAGESWDDIADTLLRTVVSVQARAAALDRMTRAAAVFAIPDRPEEERQANADEYATTGPGRPRTQEEGEQLADDYEKFVRVEHRPTPQQELARLTEEAKARRIVRPTMPKEERVPAVLEVTSRVKAEPPAEPVKPTPAKDRTFDATPRVLSKTCTRCAKAFTTDDLWLDHEGGPEHFECCQHITRTPAPKAPAEPPKIPAGTYVHAKPAKRRLRVQNGGCRGKSGSLTCCMRSQHRGEHLSETGVIFSRDGKDQWRDVGDVYLMMALNNDLVAPHP